MLTASIFGAEGSWKWPTTARYTVGDILRGDLADIKARCRPKVAAAGTLYPGRDLRMDWVHVLPREADLRQTMIRDYGLYDELEDEARWCEEWKGPGPGLAQDFSDAVDELVRAVMKGHGMSAGEVTNYPAWPTVPAQIDALTVRTRNLVALYDTIPALRAVTSPTAKPRKLWPWILGGAVALVAVGGVIYATRKKKRRR